MKRVSFIRHYRLAIPFDHWSHMSLKEFVDLTEGRADPEIETGFGPEFLELPRDIKSAEFLLVGTKKRTQQSAIAINKFLNLNIPTISSLLFDEIPSRILTIPTEREFETMKTKEKLTVKKQRVMGNEDKVIRLMEIDKYLSELPYSQILVISHSYLIGLLNYWFNIIKRRPKSFDGKMADNHEIGGWLRGFDFQF